MKKLLYFFILILAFQVDWGGSFAPYSSSRQVFSSSGKLLRFTLSKDDKYRVWEKFEFIPRYFEKAFLEKEDQFFYYHPGFNPFSLIRSGLNTYVFKTRKMGGSTISMQLARLHYKLNTKSLSGKFQQILYSIYLELKYSKKEIFSSYLNLIPFGKNIEGISAALF